MFVNGIKAIDDLCDMMWSMYTSPDSAEKLQALYDQRRKFHTGISDMVYLQRLYDTNRHRVADMSGIQPDDSYWDANVHMEEGFEMESGRKRIEFENYLPYCTQVSTASASASRACISRPRQAPHPRRLGEELQWPRIAWRRESSRQASEVYF